MFVLDGSIDALCQTVKRELCQWRKLDIRQPCRNRASNADDLGDFENILDVFAKKQL
jgi:hypothetical protein